MRQFTSAFILTLFLFSSAMAGGDDMDTGPVESLDSVQQAPVADEKVAMPAPTESEQLVITEVEEPEPTAKVVMPTEEDKMSVEEEEQKTAYTTPESLQDTPLEPVYETCEDLGASNSFMKYSCLVILTVFAIL